MLSAIFISILIIIQIAAIVVHGYILKQYKRYCGHCDWWWDTGALIFWIITFIPFIGIFACIVGPIDYIRNITETVSKERDGYKE